MFNQEQNGSVTHSYIFARVSLVCEVGDTLKQLEPSPVNQNGQFTKGSGTLMTSLYKEYAQSWDTCVLNQFAQTQQQCSQCVPHWTLLHFHLGGLTELMGTL